MRPRFANRGSQSGGGHDSAAVRGFNEAPIRESGKFDGARQLLVDSVAASMRPRFANRGSIERYASTRVRLNACFNEAPIRESGKWLAPTKVALTSERLQ